MKTEETERQGHLRSWMNVIFILGLLFGLYLFIVPFHSLLAKAPIL